MTKITARQGNRQVVTLCNGASFLSRLYVNGGETATLLSAKHKSLKGAEAWAKKAVSQ